MHCWDALRFLRAARHYRSRQLHFFDDALLHRGGCAACTRPIFPPGCLYHLVFDGRVGPSGPQCFWRIQPWRILISSQACVSCSILHAFATADPITSRQRTQSFQRLRCDALIWLQTPQEVPGQPPPAPCFDEAPWNMVHPWPSSTPFSICAWS